MQNYLAKEIKQWINGKDKKIARVMAEESVRLLTFSRNRGDRCIICNGRTVTMCPYCFTEQIYSALVENEINAKEILEFLTMFNFDFEHSGYYRARERIEEMIS